MVTGVAYKIMDELKSCFFAQFYGLGIVLERAAGVAAVLVGESPTRRESPKWLLNCFLKSKSTCLIACFCRLFV
jgi:hypothetical protein